MNSDELYTLKSMVLENYEQYHDGLRILLESDITRRSLSDKDIFCCQRAPVPSELNCYRTGKGED